MPGRLNTVLRLNKEKGQGQGVEKLLLKNEKCKACTNAGSSLLTHLKKVKTGRLAVVSLSKRITLYGKPNAGALHWLNKLEKPVRGS